jgi:HKD family nuclease
MLKFIEGHELIEEFHSLMTKGAKLDLAVAYWGKDAARNLNIQRSGHVRIICDLASGACNPYEIKKLQSFTNTEIKTHDELHAKVYCVNDVAIIGSSNASTNGLADPASRD